MTSTDSMRPKHIDEMYFHYNSILSATKIAIDIEPLGT